MNHACKSPSQAPQINVKKKDSMTERNFKYNIVQTCIIALVTLFILSACGGDSVKDYWKMDQPRLVAQQGNGSNYTEKVIANPFNGQKNFIRNGSYLEFEKIGNGVSFDINVVCKKNGFVFNRVSLNQNISKRLFLYNYLPTEVLVETENEISEPEYNCAFGVTVKNPVNSKIHYTLHNLIVTTRDFYKVSIKHPNIMPQKIYENGYTKRIIVDLNSDPKAELIAALDENFFVMEDTSVVCDGESFMGPRSEFRSRDMSINSFFRQELFNENYFFKKCRILTYSKNMPVDKTVSDEDAELVWSPYFSVFFRKPKLQVNFEAIDNQHNYYSDNNMAYNFKFAKIVIHNVGSVPAIVKLSSLPFQGDVEILSDVFLPNAGSVHNLHLKSLNDLNLPVSRLKGAIKTKAWISNETPEYIDLASGEKAEVFLEISKNFSCSIYKNRESGFWFSGIKPYSESDQIEVYVRNHNKVEKFPLDFFISELSNEHSIYSQVENSNQSIQFPYVPKGTKTSFNRFDEYGLVYEEKLQKAIKNTSSKDLMGLKNSLNNLGGVGKFCRSFPN